MVELNTTSYTIFNFVVKCISGRNAILFHPKSKLFYLLVKIVMGFNDPTLNVIEIHESMKVSQCTQMRSNLVDKGPQCNNRQTA